MSRFLSSAAGIGINPRAAIFFFFLVHNLIKTRNTFHPRNGRVFFRIPFQFGIPFGFVNGLAVSLGDAELFFQFVKSFGKFVNTEICGVTAIGANEEGMEPVYYLILIKYGDLIFHSRVFSDRIGGLKFFKGGFGVGLPRGVNWWLADIIIQ